MGLFSKKYDSIDDRLTLKFDLETKKFYYYLKDRLLLEKELNTKTRKSLYRINEQLKNPEYLKKIVEQEEIKKLLTAEKEKTDYLKSKGYIFESFSTLKGFTPQGTMSKQIENLLLPLINNKQNLVGIHRVKDIISNDKIEDILLNGLILCGHLSGATNKRPSLSEHVSYYPDNRFILNELMFCNEYKNSQGSILVNIPISSLDDNVIIKNDKEIMLNPKYIVGYIPLYENHHLENIITSDDILYSKMDKMENGYNYIPGETIEKYKNKSINYKYR